MRFRYIVKKALIDMVVTLNRTVQMMEGELNG